MPNRLKTACAYPRCPELCEPGQRYCDKHKRQYDSQYNKVRGSAASRGYNKRWQKIRAMVLADEPLCRECAKHGIVKAATDVHHIDGNVANMDRSNLEPLCHECHSRKTAVENGRWG